MPNLKKKKYFRVKGLKHLAVFYIFIKSYAEILVWTQVIIYDHSPHT